ncbi:hypothetical protein GLOIN_2v1531016 [Rhizophagus clarus]|uniref:Uncharacterized protein n=1 Tax=Rhizophagus clarus TaxID=94130 RepID=A0A8H3LTI2_9GLOM|nr:hypothetical protein GLOIN_2v1531016 [Rhizophagus clarus]
MTFQIPIDFNRLWCEISVRILWRNIVYKDIQSFENDKLFVVVVSSILNTLFTCLPNESKELLYQNEIFISTPISKQPLFNYATFCKAFSIYEINRMVDNVFRPNFFFEKIILLPLSFSYYFSFPYFPGVRDLSELHCCSCLPSNFFHQLSQLCQNLQSISISFCDSDASNGLKELISLQNNLKTLKLSAEYSSCDIIPTLEKTFQYYNKTTSL